MNNLVSAFLVVVVLLLVGSSILGIQKQPGTFGIAGYLAVGIAVVSLIFHGLGAIHILVPKGFAGCTLVAALIGLFRCKRVSWKLFQNMTSSLKFRHSYVEMVTVGVLVGIIGILVSPVFRWNIREAAGYDALAYHMYSPLRALWWTHSLNANDLSPNAGLPISAGSIHSLFVLFGGDPRSSLINLLIIATLLIGSIRVIASLKVGLITAVVVALVVLTSGPLTFGQLSSDMLLAMFMPILFRRTQAIVSEATTLTAGDIVLLANLPFVKSFGIIPMIIFCIFGVLHLRAVRAFWMLLVTLAPTLGWWIKNYFQVSNPFFPMFSNIFRTKFDDPRAMSPKEPPVLPVPGRWQDVRRPFDQLNDFFHDDFDWNLFSARNDNSAFLALVLMLGGIALVITSWGTFTRIDKGMTVILVTSSAGIFLMGGEFRYLLFVWILLTVLLVKHIYHATADSNGGRSRRRVAASFASTLLILLVPQSFRGNGTSELFRGRDNTGRIAEAAIALEESISDNEIVCVFGEGRLLQFWPSRTQYLSPDLRNPFTSTEEISPSDIKYQLRRLRCSYLLLFEGWGRPLNLNLSTLLKWKSFETPIDLVPEGGWFLYQLF